MRSKAKALKDFTYSEDGILVKKIKKGDVFYVLDKHKRGLENAEIITKKSKQSALAGKGKMNNPVNVIKHEASETESIANDEAAETENPDKEKNK